MYFSMIPLRILLDRLIPWWPFLLPLLHPHPRNPVKRTRFVYNDSIFGLSLKNYNIHVSVALVLDLIGLQHSFTSYQWQYGLFGSFTMIACARQHQLGSCCLASCIEFILHLSFSLCPHCSFRVELCCSPTLYFRPWHTWCRPIALSFYGCCLRRLFCAKTEF